MNKQAVFDHIVLHLRTQGVQSRTPNGKRSLYRGPDGTKCAIGCLIPDDRYNPVIEGDDVEYVWQTTDMLSGIARCTDLLSDMQDAHDRCGPARWEDQFQYIAEKHQLIYTSLETK